MKHYKVNKQYNKFYYTNSTNFLGISIKIPIKNNSYINTLQMHYDISGFMMQMKLKTTNILLCTILTNNKNENKQQPTTIDNF